jgi:hypothetical protein
VFGSWPVSWGANWTSVGVGFYDPPGNPKVGCPMSRCGTSLVRDEQPESGLPMRWRSGETLHRGRMVSLFFDIRSLFNHRWTQINTDEGEELIFGPEPQVCVSLSLFLMVNGSGWRGFGAGGVDWLLEYRRTGCNRESDTLNKLDGRPLRGMIYKPLNTRNTQRGKIEDEGRRRGRARWEVWNFHLHFRGGTASSAR